MSIDKIEIYSHSETDEKVKKTWSCKAVVLEVREGVVYILLTPSEHDGQMSVPGGSMQVWEEAFDTLQRECREELQAKSFEIMDAQLITTTEKIFPSPKDNRWRHKVYSWYHCTRKEWSDLGTGRFFPLSEALSVVKDFERDVLAGLASEPKGIQW